MAIKTRLIHGGFLLAGLGGAAYLIMDSDEQKIIELLGRFAPHLFTISLVHLSAILAAAAAWYVLLDRSHGGVRMRDLFVFRWIGDAVNQLLPVAQIGGEVVRTRLLILATGVTGTAATAATVVDLTAGFVALIVYILVGFLLLAWQGGQTAVPLALGIGIAAFSLLLGVFLALQRGGAIAWAGRRLPFAWARTRAQSFQASLTDVYGRGGDFAACVGFRLVAWFVGAVVIWLALGFLGAPVSFTEALIIDGIAQGVRNAGFFVPGGFGVQEGAYVVAGALVDLGPEAALALSLVKRLRDVVLGLPALLAWHLAERRYARS